MVRTPSVQQVRAITWIGWPLLMLIAVIALLHFTRNRLGWGIYWAWTPLHLLQVLLVFLGPGILLEAIDRKERNNG